MSKDDSELVRDTVCESRAERAGEGDMNAFACCCCCCCCWYSGREFSTPAAAACWCKLARLVALVLLIPLLILSMSFPLRPGLMFGFEFELLIRLGFEAEVKLIFGAIPFVPALRLPFEGPEVRLLFVLALGGVDKSSTIDTCLLLEALELDDCIFILNKYFSSELELELVYVVVVESTTLDAL